MARVFLSYRRGDAAWASHLDRIEGRNGISTYFRDSVGIKDAQDFAQRIVTELENSDVVLVGVGSTWINRILDLRNSDDWVRQELLLAQDKIVYPILFGDTELPKRGDIPTELQHIFDRNASRLSDPPNKPLSDISRTIRNIFKEEQDNIEKAALNGLKAVLNIAWRRLSNQIKDTFTVYELAQLLVPDLISSTQTGSGNLSSLLLGTDANTRLETIDGFAGIVPISNYTPLNIGDRRVIRVATAEVKSKLARMIVAYEILLPMGQSRFVVVEFRYPNASPINYTDIINCVGDRYFNDGFRLPNMPIFQVKIPENDYSHTFKPLVGDGDINTDQFTRLFDIQWLGSKNILSSDRFQLLQAIKELGKKHNLIHCIEEDKATVKLKVK